jgi:outer membrane protein TolC
MKWTGRIAAGLLLGVALGAGAAEGQTPLTAERAVQLALEHNSQIINANADVLSARSSAYGAWAAVLPSVGASLTRSGAQTRNQSGTVVVAGQTTFPNSTPEYDVYATTPELSGAWSVLNLSSIANVASARAGLQSVQWQRRATRSSVALQAREQFYEVVKAVKLVEVNEHALVLARDNERRVGVLFEVGSVSRSDLLKAQVQTAQGQLDSIAAVQNLLAQRNALASFIGLEEARLGEVDTTLAASPMTYDEAAVLREAEENRPDLKAARTALRSARAGVWSARLSWLPYVTVAGSVVVDPFSDTKTFDAAGDPSSAHSEYDRRVSGSVALNWDFFDPLSRSASGASARAQLARAQSNYDVLRRNLAGEVHQATLTYQQALASERLASTALASAAENMKLTQQKYNVGSATILDLIDAQVQLQRAESQRVSALAGIRVAEARLDQVRGRDV